ncbi:hypothetical protein [Pantoea septica]|uniref:hypothetical protein n=1 Tax=Pantoea septica TaxID=472695 RepID=UPI00289BC6B7|nr:hypothetical protein [Pantoea septica]
MTERPIIFNADMVRAVLNGSKTQTRRVIQSAAKNMQARGHEVISHRAPGDKWYGDYVYSMRDRSGVWQDFTNEQFLAKCPFGAVGDRLWVRETFATLEPGSYEPVTPCDGYAQVVRYAASDRLANSDRDVRGFNWRPSIHMPRWASRITLEITGVRVERLQDISHRDACREGLFREEYNWRENEFPLDDIAYRTSPTAKTRFSCPKQCFQELWESIYKPESWQANPWVWVIEFRRVEDE